MSVDVSVAGLTFEGFAPAFAQRAEVAFTAAMTSASVTSGTSREMGVLVLEGLDFSTPERLGHSLARAILREVAR